MIDFNAKYNRDIFLNFLRESFLPESTNYRLEVTNKAYKVVKEASVLGHNEDMDLYILEMSHSRNNDPRISIATDAFKIMSDLFIQKALVIFKNEDTNNYRFSYLTITLDINEKDKVTKSYSNARRYSFFLGENAKVKTPEQQLIKQGKVKDIDDLQKRFSVEVVNKQFYLEIAKLFDELVKLENKNLTLPNKNEDMVVRKSFAVRLIGRIVFCWFLKQKNSTAGKLVPDEILSSGVINDNENYYHNLLEPLFFGILNTPIGSRDIRGKFFDQVPYLNGGLFNPQSEDFYEFEKATFSSRFINTLIIENKWFKSFFELLETYNFTIDENTVFDLELSVDPEMLGRIFENLLAEINPESGISERKRTGSFYTPRQIVEYMVDQSLIEYLSTKTEIERQKLEALVSYDLNDDKNFPLTEEEKIKVVQAVQALKILDPACGSGAFPIGTLQKLVYILQNVDPNCNLWLSEVLKNVPELYRGSILNHFKNNPPEYTRKLEVIKNSIFGVDIQPIAVDVSRLRCFLTLIVESEIDDAKQNRGIEPLPNLDFKFVCANTLIGLPKQEKAQQGLFEDEEGIHELLNIMSEYFSANNARKFELKQKFITTQKNITQRTIGSFGTSTGDLTVKLIKWDPFENKSNDWFDPKWMFGLEEKFDVVIANPPYIDSETMVRNTPEFRDYCVENFETTKGNWDLYIPFMEFSINLLNESGLTSVIVPNKWLSIPYGITFREFIKNKIFKIGNLKNIKVFEAGNNPVVAFYGNQDFEKKLTVDLFNSQYLICDKFEIDIDSTELNFGLLISENIQIILKIKQNSVKLEQFYNVENPCSVSEAYKISENLISLVSESDYDNKKYFKLVNTGTIDPFVSLWGNKITTYLKNKYKYPVISSTWLKDSLPNRFRQSSERKIIVSGMRNFESFLDNKGEYLAGKSTEIILPKNDSSLEKLVNILNSNFIKFYIKESFSVLGIDGGINFSVDMIKNLPLPINFLTQENMEVNLYNLYNLTEEEIKIIEGK